MADLGRRLFVVCNKADRLDSPERAAVQLEVQRSLERHGAWAALAHPPFLLSAKAANEARDNGDPAPELYAAFINALWASLWKTESIGLRRLFRVFEELGMASEEVAVLIEARKARAPERARLRAVLQKGEGDRASLQSAQVRVFAETWRATRINTEQLRARLSDQVVMYVEGLPNESDLPRVSDVAERFTEEVTVGWEAVASQLAQALAPQLADVDPEIERRLSALRNEIGVAGAAATMSATVRGLPEWQRFGSEASPTGWRSVGRVATAGGAFALTMLALGGAPLAIAGVVASVAGVVATAIYDFFTDRAESKPELAEKAVLRLWKTIDHLEGQLEQGLHASSKQVANHIDARMSPFLGDLARHLDNLREPTAEELKLFARLTDEVEAALKLLRQVFAIPPAPTQP